MTQIRHTRFSLAPADSGRIDSDAISNSPVTIDLTRTDTSRITPGTIARVTAPDIAAASPDTAQWRRRAGPDPSAPQGTTNDKDHRS